MKPRRIPGPLVADLIATAELLAASPGQPTFRQACMRRAVSGAYDAVFHAPCATFSDALVGWSKASILAPIYRSLDHGPVLKKLRSREARQIDERIERVAFLFGSLQEQRHAADYAPPSPLFSRTQTLTLVADAQEAVSLSSGLEAPKRLQLAILPIARQRAA
ncbi:hypothetical protein AFCDBAGC_0538 [Methylobacterium cerastii]|uniref:Uncharacterized protein n=2 Tax=Methylobacterium TaxID=407 RepID=A0ABQ4QC88_9HYPH|nr:MULTISPECIES: hypothetical protein [Methylobacterium]TXN02231.1 hypothetical protein FV222_09765 [Methylobacterium sp. WL103]TXN13966.1 hypothetical protein FV219_04070 [Methylobacterium sp. WL122]TXM76821.1 hypothetical protein FV226_00990 [Methylobacterium sp. WL12]TXN80650.1 hypothetical protein FV234_16070 [Methylobacterium sp. WL8]GJD42699.1 hypothetical protein AFCDBAGC_0538 [Methylobacterium cerastii]